MTINLSSISTGALSGPTGPTGPTGPSGPTGPTGPSNILQVVQATTNTQVVVNTATYTDTGLSCSITPISATSKILVQVCQQYNNQASTTFAFGGIQLLRGSTVIYDPNPVDATGPSGIGMQVSTGTTGRIQHVFNINYLDSPATTSTLTYKTQGRPYQTASSMFIAFQVSNANQNGTSSIILMEIAA